MTLTISGIVTKIEKAAGKTLWAAFVLDGLPAWKVIFSNQLAEKSLKEISVGDMLVADGTNVKVAGDVFKLFAQGYLNVGRPLNVE